MSEPEMHSLFDLSGRVFVITGGTGLLGRQHAAAIAGAGGIPVLADIAPVSNEELQSQLGFAVDVIPVNISQRVEVEGLLSRILDRYGRVDGLINNAANNPKVEASGQLDDARLESFPLDRWEADIAVGLTGAFLCSKIIGAELARRRSGVIVNVASDLAIIAPDQRLYRKEGLPDHVQPTKPVTYSVVKTALVGLTRYLATYWADAGVRVNSLSPGGVENGQSDVFLSRIANLIPLGRMARRGEYQGAILFLCSDASSYMTGTNLVIDGGRSCW
jgi:NAD(P)-dependent dehydrogenase (short-subunit alcohol dehydrogenase family)